MIFAVNSLAASMATRLRDHGQDSTGDEVGISRTRFRCKDFYTCVAIVLHGHVARSDDGDSLRRTRSRLMCKVFRIEHLIAVDRADARSDDGGDRAGVTSVGLNSRQEFDPYPRTRRRCFICNTSPPRAQGRKPGTHSANTPHANRAHHGHTFPQKGVNQTDTHYANSKRTTKNYRPLIQ